MLTNIKYVLIIISVLIINSCLKEDDNITNQSINSVDFGDTTNAILLSSFEFNGMAELQGWGPIDSISNYKYSFSNDVPNGGGCWSLQIRGIKYNVSGVKTTLDLSGADSLKNYILTFWAKGKGNLYFDLYTSDRGVVNFVPIDYETWTFFTDTLFRYDVLLNKLTIHLTSWDSDSLSCVLFDNIKVVVKSK